MTSCKKVVFVCEREVEESMRQLINTVNKSLHSFPKQTCYNSSLNILIYDFYDLEIRDGADIRKEKKKKRKKGLFILYSLRRPSLAM